MSLFVRLLWEAFLGLGHMIWHGMTCRNDIEILLTYIHYILHLLTHDTTKVRFGMN